MVHFDNVCFSLTFEAQAVHAATTALQEQAKQALVFCIATMMYCSKGLLLTEQVERPRREQILGGTL